MKTTESKKRADQIARSLDKNVSRVRNLISIYRQTPLPRQGRKSIQTEDILRQATVLLHSTLEEFVRSVESWRLPFADPESLEAVRLAGIERRADKFTLPQLARHRGKTVDEVIKESVDDYLQTKSYGNPAEVVTALEKVGIDRHVFSELMRDLSDLMKRRHSIVHSADRLDKKGRGYHGAKSIGVGIVTRWVDSVEKFARLVLEELAGT